MQTRLLITAISMGWTKVFWFAWTWPAASNMWKARGGQYGHGQLLLSHDLLVVLAETGEFAAGRSLAHAFRELGRIQAIDGKTWNNPVLVGPRIFVRNHLEMAAYDLPTEPDTNLTKHEPADEPGESSSSAPHEANPP